MPFPKSPWKYRIFQQNNTTQFSKHLQVAPADDRGLKKLELKEVIQATLNTMQTLSVFEKQFTKQ